MKTIELDPGGYEDRKRNAETRRRGGQSSSAMDAPLLMPRAAAMKFCITGVVLFMTWIMSAATNDLTSLLQRGLFEEEANRNLDAAITSYESLAKEFDQNRQIAATAVFRLGECYRKLGKTNEAVVQYERIVREFADQATLVTLSRQNLAGLGAAPAASGESGQRSPQFSESASDEARRLAAQLAGIEQLKSDPAAQARAVLAFFPDDNLKQMLAHLPKLQEQEARIKATPQLSLSDLGGFYIAMDPERGAYIQPHSTNLLSDTQNALRQQMSWITERVDFIVGIQKARLQALQAAAGTERPDITGHNASTLSTDEEEKEIRRIQAMIQNSPDLINAPNGDEGTPLFQAAKNGWLQVARYLLDHGAEVNQRSGSHGKIWEEWTPLIAAADNGHKAMVELLLSRGADINLKGQLIGTALCVAVGKNLQATAEALLEHNADPNIPGTQTQFSQKHTPLCLAAKNQNPQLVKLLIAKGADVNATSISDVTALYAAASRPDTNIVKALLAAGANVRAKTTDFNTTGNTALHAAAAANQAGNIPLLLAGGAEINAQNERNETPLIVSVKYKSPAAARALLQAKADPNLTGTAEGDRPGGFSPAEGRVVGIRESWTPLHYAAKANDREIIQLLVANGADPNLKPSGGEQPLFSAVRALQEAAAIALLENKANPNVKSTSKDREDWTPLHYAAEKGSARLVEALLQHGADPNVRTGLSPRSELGALSSGPNNEDLTGATPLYVATRRDDPAIVKILLAHKASPNIPTKNFSVYPLNVAIWKPDAELTELLLQNGADVNARTRDGETALHSAILSKNKAMVEMVLAHKPDVNAMNNNDGQTALDLTRGKQELSDIAMLLREHGALDEVPKLDRIQVHRASASFSETVFMRSTNDWNHYTLFELFGVHYGFISTWSASTGVPRDFDRASFTLHGALAFPDLARIVIRRPSNGGKEWKNIPMDLESIFQSSDCGRDVPLEWGDVIEIPEQDHPLGQIWGGFTSHQDETLTKCLQRQVELIVNQQMTNILLMPRERQGSVVSPIPGAVMFPEQGVVRISVPQFSLVPILNGSGLLRTSSDLSHVKVTRRATATRKTQEWIVDCSDPKNPPNLWLRDGDRIEVREK